MKEHIKTAWAVRLTVHDWVSFAGQYWFGNYAQHTDKAGLTICLFRTRAAARYACKQAVSYSKMTPIKVCVTVEEI
jgi:hypothetical protein